MTLIYLVLSGALCPNCYGEFCPDCHLCHYCEDIDLPCGPIFPPDENGTSTASLLPLSPSFPGGAAKELVKC